MANDLWSITNELPAVERGDEVLVRDRGETSVVKTRRGKVEQLSEQSGSYSEPSQAQQLNFAVAFGLAPSSGVTDYDIGGRGGLSWRFITPTIWNALPNRSSGSNNVERRGQATITGSGTTLTLRVSWWTLYYNSGVSRFNTDVSLRRLNKFDTIRLDAWSNYLSGEVIEVPFLIVSTPTRDTTTESYVFQIRQIRTGAAITVQHRVPAASNYPHFGLSVGVRQQKASPLSDAIPRSASANASPGVSDEGARSDHTHPVPNALRTLTDAAVIAWNVETSPNAQVIITANRNMGAPTGAFEGGYYIITVMQDNVGGRELSWNSIYTFSSIGGDAPSLSEGANIRDKIAFTYEGAKMRLIGLLLDV